MPTDPAPQCVEEGASLSSPSSVQSPETHEYPLPSWHEKGEHLARPTYLNTKFTRLSCNICPKTKKSKEEQITMCVCCTCTSLYHSTICKALSHRLSLGSITPALCGYTYYIHCWVRKRRLRV